MTTKQQNLGSKNEKTPDNIIRNEKYGDFIEDHSKKGEHSEKNDVIRYPSAKDIISSGIILPSTAKFKDLIQVIYNDTSTGAIIIDGDINKNYMITKNDIIQFLYNRQKHISTRRHAENYSTRDFPPLIDLFDVPLNSLMKGPVEIFDEDLSIDVLIKKMVSKGIETALIGKSGQPSGIITLYDILAWNNEYFSHSNPLILLVMDNQSAIILGRYDFMQRSKQIGMESKEELVSNSESNQNAPSEFVNGFNHVLVDLYGAALKSIDAVTNEVIENSGHLRVIEKENYTILLEPRNFFTGILICTNNNIEMRKRISRFMDKFEKRYRDLEPGPKGAMMAKLEVDISDIAQNF